MRQLVIVPLYHLKTLYSHEKIFNPLNTYLDLTTLLEILFNPQAYGEKFDIWNAIEAKRSIIIFDSVAQSGVSVDEMFDNDESSLYEMLDVMIDMFIEVSYKLLSSYLNLDQSADFVRSFKVVNDSVYILIEK